MACADTVDPHVARVLPGFADRFAHGDTDIFDITISDAAYLGRVVLSPSLNGLVLDGAIGTGSVVQILEWEVAADDTEIADRLVILVTDVKCVAATTGSEPLVPVSGRLLHPCLPLLPLTALLATCVVTQDAPLHPALTVVDAARQDLVKPQPLLGLRGWYLPQWSDDRVHLLPEWQAFAAAHPLGACDDLASYQLPTLVTVSQRSFARGRGVGEDDGRPLALVGRLGIVGRLVYFGHPEKKQPCPCYVCMCSCCGCVRTCVGPYAVLLGLAVHVRWFALGGRNLTAVV